MSWPKGGWEGSRRQTVVLRNTNRIRGIARWARGRWYSKPHGIRVAAMYMRRWRREGHASYPGRSLSLFQPKRSKKSVEGEPNQNVQATDGLTYAESVEQKRIRGDRGGGTNRIGRGGERGREVSRGHCSRVQATKGRTMKVCFVPEFRVPPGGRRAGERSCATQGDKWRNHPWPWACPVGTARRIT